MAKETPREREMRELRDTGKEFVGILKEMNKIMGQFAKETEMAASEAEKNKRATEANVSLANRLSNFTKEDLKNTAKRKSFEDALSKAKKEQVSLTEEVDKLYAKLEDKTKGLSDEDKTQLSLKQRQLETSRSLVKEAEKLKSTISKYEKSTQFFDKMSEFVEEIPVIRKLFPEFKKASEAARDASADGASGLGVMFAGLKSLSGALVKFLGLNLVEGLNRLDKRTIEVGRSLNMTSGEAAQLQDQLFDATIGRMVDIDKVQDSIIGLSKSLGVTTAASAETGIQLEKLTGKLGLSEEQAANLFKTSTLTEESFASGTNAMIGQVMAQNLATDSAIRYQDVMGDVADAADQVLVNTSKFPGGVAQAAFQARRFGLELNQVANAGKSLLDFEQSIQNELEAEVLLGRALNLDRARAAALMGDQATVAEEIADQVGDLAGFRELNVIQQEALAKSMGMEASEVAGMLMQREAMLKLEKDTGIEGLSKLETQKQLAELEKKGLSRAEAYDALGKSELARQERNLTAQEKASLVQKDAADRMAKAVSDLTESLTGENNPFALLTKSLDYLVEKMNEILIIGGALAALKFGNFLGLGRAGSSLLKSLRGSNKAMKGLVKSASSPTGFRNAAGQFAKGPAKASGGLFSGIGKFMSKASKKVGGFFKGAGKKVAKAGLGSLLKKIPGVGLLTGIGFGISRAMQGDIAGALGEVASGASSLIPGVGTAISTAIDAGLIARDMGAFGDAPGSRGAQNVDVADFILKPLDADTITMAGGTKLGGNVENLLEKLISVVEQGGDVILDGSKVGDTLVMNSRLAN